MKRPATTPATAREIILEIVRNMRDGIEPLQYTVLAPAIYHVYLHSDDLERLRGIIPRIIDEARLALDNEVGVLNRAPLTEKLRLSRKPAPKVEAPADGWHVEPIKNTDDETKP